MRALCAAAARVEHAATHRCLTRTTSLHRSRVAREGTTAGPGDDHQCTLPERRARNRRLATHLSSTAPRICPWRTECGEQKVALTNKRPPSLYRSKSRLWTVALFLVAHTQRMDLVLSDLPFTVRTSILAHTGLETLHRMKISTEWRVTVAKEVKRRFDPELVFPTAIARGPRRGSIDDR